MDNSSGGGTPTQPPAPAAPPPGAPHPQFTVPVPTYSTPTQSLPMTGPSPTEGPHGAQVPVPEPAERAGQASTMAYAASPLPAEGPSDAESLRNLALVLFGVAAGFWVFVVIRMMARIVEVGGSSRLLIETIDQTSVETVTAALISVFALASALVSRVVAGRGASIPFVWTAGVLALVTVAATVWRLV